MGILTWLYGKGLAGAISRDLINKFLRIKKQNPLEENKDILKRVWSLWLTLNEEAIRKNDNYDKVLRLEGIQESINKEGILGDMHFKSLMTLYQHVLYIESEISVQDKKIFDRCMQIFVNEGKKHGLDFTKEYENYKRIFLHSFD